ncbi:Uncharacterized protein RNJ44_03807 [Nakaseomyces bracarensis]|uniref:Uncharacterized protein n=1 Tax=Nakaseomyces bracarensis TaxID=273131 RepID=A0ABR4NYI4_9SACH
MGGMDDYDELDKLEKVSSVRRQSEATQMPSFLIDEEFGDPEPESEQDTELEQDFLDLEEANNQDNSLMFMVPRTLPQSKISQHLQSIRLRSGIDDSKTDNSSRPNLGRYSGRSSLIRTSNQMLPTLGGGNNSNSNNITNVNNGNTNMNNNNDLLGANLLQREDTLSTWQRSPNSRLLRASTYPETEEEQKQSQLLHDRESYKLVVPPNVDSQERLWQEVANLDQIKRFSRDLKFATSMFPQGFEENLGELKKLQNNLVHELRNYNAELEEQERIDIAKQAAADILTFTPPDSLHNNSTDSLLKSSSAIRLGGFGSSTNLKAEKYLRELFEKIKEMG